MDDRTDRVRPTRGRRRGAVLVALALAAALLSTADVLPSAADANEAPGSPAAAGISAGFATTCARLADGTVKCWGANASGQLGQGDTTTRGDDASELGANLVPIDMGTGRTATAVTTGGTWSCARLDNGQVKCWGLNNHGQLGLGDVNNRGDGPGEMGDNLPAVDLGAGRTAIAVAASESHTCAVLDNGQVKCWGTNASGQLGIGDTLRRGDGPGEMGDSLPAVALGTGRTATAVAVGGSHTCALLDNGQVKCWGLNTYGQLGIGDIGRRGDGPGEMGDALPAVDLGFGRTATAVTAGDNHTCVLLDNGQVKCWGLGGSGQLGIGGTNNRGDGPGEMGDNIPTVALGTGRTATAVTAGGANTCALLDDGSVKCWGDGRYGQNATPNSGYTGDETVEMGDALPAVDLGPGVTALAVTLGSTHVCAITSTPAVKCWGRNQGGQLGVGDAIDRGLDPEDLGAALPAVSLTGTGVTGRITDSVNGSVVRQVLVGVLDPNTFGLVNGGVSNGDGTFSVAAPPGTYYLYLVDRSGQHTASFYGGGLVPVVVTGLVTVAGTLSPVTGAICGHVTDATTHSAVPGAIAIAISTTTGAPELTAVADANGDYVLNPLRPGAHTVAVLDPTGAHQTRFHPAATDTAGATPVTVTPGQCASADIELPGATAPGRAHTIIGEVGTAGTALVIALRAADFSLARGTLTDGAGRYTLFLDPGTYKLAFISTDGTESMQWFDGQPGTSLGTATTVTSPALVDAALNSATGTIRGVAAVDGVAHTNVWALAIGPNGVAAGTVSSSTSDPNYAITGLPPGNYRMAFVYPPAGAVQYYAGQPNFDTASTFAVVAGRATRIDADL